MSASAADRTSIAFRACAPLCATAALAFAAGAACATPSGLAHAHASGQGAGTPAPASAQAPVRTPSTAPASVAGAAPVDIAWNRFYDELEVRQIVERMVAEYPTLLTLETIGTSSQGRPLQVVVMNNPATGPASDKPVMWIDGNVHGNEVQATETVLYSIDRLCRAHGSNPRLTALIDRVAFHFMPTMNPDSRAAWFSEVNSPNSSRTGQAPWDDDGDGLVDEDPPNDLDGDGSIGSMWRRDPNGTHRRSARDPRIMERVPREPRPDGTVERGEWSMVGQEGIDDDGDGRINEDGPGSYDMNRSWPSDWHPNHVQRGAGPIPLYWPETRAVANWLLAHPNVAGAQSYHNTGAMILRGPGAPYREGDYPDQDRAVYDAIATAGEEMLPFYRKLVIHSDLYTVHGGFVNWLAEGLGIIAFTNELWSDKRILQDGRTPDEAGRMRWIDRMLFGENFTEWTEVPHPDYGTVLVGGGTKWSSRIPPGFMLEEECHRNFAFTMHHADQMPLLRVAHSQARPLGPDLWEVTVEIANDRRIPTRTARAAQRRIGMPDLAALTGDGIEVVTAGPMADRLSPAFNAVEHRPGTLRVESGIPGLGERTFRFIVRAAPGRTATFRYSAEKARGITLDIPLGK
jgi:murein tripeptide amidase MpaA